MNLKLIALGGLAFYLMTWVISFVTGPLIHNGILAEAYLATNSFWRPALTQVPPDMAALMPRWVVTGLSLSFVMAGLYGCFRPAIAGSGFARGAKFGLLMSLLVAATMASWSGFFNLPDKIWFWWIVEALFTYVICGGVLGWVADRWCAPTASA
jgi:hypothetical protein